MRKTAAHRLEDVRAVLAATMAQLAEKEGERNGALLAGKDTIEIGKIDAEIATLRHAARTENDRIKLLEIQATKERQAAGARQRQGHVTRFAKLLADSVADAEEIEGLAEQLLKTVRRCISRRERALVGFNVKSSHANAAARAIEGAALSGDAVMAHLAGHLYKISCRPLLGAARERKRSRPCQARNVTASIGSGDIEGSKRLIEFLASARASETIRKSGMEPLATSR